MSLGGGYSLAMNEAVEKAKEDVSLRIGVILDKSFFHWLLFNFRV